MTCEGPTITFETFATLQKEFAFIATWNTAVLWELVQQDLVERYEISMTVESTTLLFNMLDQKERKTTAGDCPATDCSVNSEISAIKLPALTLKTLCVRFVRVELNSNMANELTLNVSLGFTKAGVTPFSMGSGATKVSVADHHYIRNTVVATATPQALALCPGVPGYCIVRNADQTSNPLFSILIAGNDDPTTALISLKPGEWALFRLNPQATPYIKINPALLGRAATAGAITFTQGIATIPVADGGSLYATAPTVTISGDGTGARAHVVVDSGIVTGVVVDNPGTGYTTATATFTGGGGSGAAADAITFVSRINTVPVTDGGVLNYSAPTVTISGNGTGATARATVSKGGVVTGVIIDNPGTGYTTATATFSKPADLVDGLDAEYLIISD